MTFETKTGPPQLLQWTLTINGPNGRLYSSSQWLKHIPCKKIKHISHKPPWLSDSLLAECKLKSQLFHLSKTQPTEENSKKYWAQRNRVIALICRARKDFASSFDNICGRQNDSNLWSLMKNSEKYQTTTTSLTCSLQTCTTRSLPPTKTKPTHWTTFSSRSRQPTVPLTQFTNSVLLHFQHLPACAKFKCLLPRCAQLSLH